MSQKQTNTRTIIGLTAIALAIGSLLITLPSLASAIFASSFTSQSGQGNLSALLTNHEEDLDTYLDRFEGRSLFFRPTPYPPPAQPRKETPKEDVKPPKLGPPPTYTGPKVIGAFGSEVWFKDNLKIPVGEEKNRVKVLQINAPWTVKLGHAGGEYVVPIFSDRLTDSDEFSSPLKLKSIPGITYEEEDPAESDNSGDDKKRERVQQ